ncbi:nucleotidyltransferase and HEPN domain-containing protein [Phyllobacterium myrsinacearum]|uniref:Putative nucleotidyltransferase/HEPN domain-containing protein n=1 Tax=Phyllobacterium myrsinacearum TaxID=28101 RepID=A0A839EK98_9HYPH|nr:nucleotidyltransferase and HEPN domain-containing protein [Phyllobacterium myrsinacearum]MBA8879292.1 putative nucleotidyltransferase/HEPN domain-containing protein [Phyllobacterium myrsinacearum]
MNSSLDHLPPQKQRELARVLEIIHEAFADMAGVSAEVKKRGRIFKIILFGSYARGTWVDEPHTTKGYRSDYDILVIVNTRELTAPELWDKATDRLMWDKGVRTPVGLIVHGAREVNNFLSNGQYFFADIRRQGIVLYEMDNRPLAEPKPMSPQQAFEIAEKHSVARFRMVDTFVESAIFRLQKHDTNGTAFMLHQAVEHMYSALLLTLTNYSPPSHNLKFLRGLAEDKDHRLVEAWPRDQQRFTAWYNTLNEAYVKARYSHQYDISEEALSWLAARASILHDLVKTICAEHLDRLERAASANDGA